MQEVSHEGHVFRTFPLSIKEVLLQDLHAMVQAFQSIVEYGDLPAAWGGGGGMLDAAPVDEEAKLQKCVEVLEHRQSDLSRYCKALNMPALYESPTRGAKGITVKCFQPESGSYKAVTLATAAKVAAHFEALTREWAAAVAKAAGKKAGAAPVSGAANKPSVKRAILDFVESYQATHDGAGPWGDNIKAALHDKYGWHKVSIGRVCAKLVADGSLIHKSGARGYFLPSANHKKK